MSLKHLVYGFAGVLLLAMLGCEDPHPDVERTVSSSTITLELPAELGALQRPPVEFEHGEHTEALEDKGCEACHLKGDDGGLIHKFNRKDDVSQGDALKDLYHDKCMGCHKERSAAGQKSGPVVCAQCHVAQAPESVSLRQEMAFDYSLHFRHVQATQEKCEKCHHVYDERRKKLEYVKEKEDACSDCHGDKDDGKNLSLKNASHASCITCHTEAKNKGKKHGPVLCTGCHDAASQEKFERVARRDIPRLKRGQKDKIWISAEDAKSEAVPFNHEDHEKETTFCTTCHHKTPKPCKECHTLTGKKEGGGVTMEKAYHLASSKRSCVGCHKMETEKKECAGCHTMPRMHDSPGSQACVICHTGPPTSQTDEAPASEVKLADLPVSSDDFPDTTVIDTLKNRYMPSKMPHRKMVAALDKAVRDNKLARKFHGRTETLCAGCHHNQPLGARPRPCKACHGAEAVPAKDKPALRAAYHRQCMGCHEAMKIEKGLGCTDCHEKAEKEVSK